MIVQKFVNAKAFSCNLYILSGEKGNILIDPGYYDESIHNYIVKIGGISSILITHGHFDHIMGINDLIKDFPSCKVYIFALEERLFFKPSLNCSSFISNPYIPSCPGHTKGSCMYYFKEENILFTGDTLIGESIGRSDLPTGNENELYLSLIKIKSYPFNDNTRCYFGHEKALSYKQLKEMNPYLK